jgi:hypothetical protein
MSNNTNQLEDPLVEESLSDTSINSPNIRGILKKQMNNLEKLREEQNLKQMYKMLTTITFIVVYTPIIAFNLYFAYTNNTSCVSTVIPNIGLNLYYYLSVQAYSMALTLGLIILGDFVDSTAFKTFYKIYVSLYRVFFLAWISIGIILFVFITHKRLCSNGIYYYVTIMTAILTFCTIVSIIQHYKDEAKLNNNST